jgi:8-oxo-dGTP pyrophosphatase MutT (NUDIX family)
MAEQWVNTNKEKFVGNNPGLIATLTSERDAFLRLVNTAILKAAWNPKEGLAGQKSVVLAAADHKIMMGIPLNAEGVEPWVYLEQETEKPSSVVLPILRRGTPGDYEYHIVLVKMQPFTLGNHKTDKQWLLSLPSGGRNSNEPDDIAAKRELWEETGLTASKMISVLDTINEPKAYPVKNKYFIGLIDEKTPQTDLSQRDLDPLEEAMALTTETIPLRNVWAELQRLETEGQCMIAPRVYTGLGLLFQHLGMHPYMVSLNQATQGLSPTSPLIKAGDVDRH